MRNRNGSEEIGIAKSAPLGLTDEMIERNDAIDNAVYDCILILSEDSSGDLPWDMEIIGDVTDAIKAALASHDIKVRHPGIVTEEDGRQYYED